MYKNLLPIGSVVLLHGGNKRIMIIGRIQTRGGDDHIYDYAACYYPEGLDGNNLTFFDRDAIERVFFLGFQDVEEFKVQEEVFAKLGELEVRDGAIVEKEA